MPPSVVLTSPSDGDTATGTITLSATVDDDVPVASVQFLVDGAPAGPPLSSAPYTTTWHPTSLNGGTQVHVITAQVLDAMGRAGTSASAAVATDNGPQISQLDTSRGLSSTHVVITWQTDTPSDTQLEYGTSITYGSSSPLDPAPTSTHVVELTGLQPGTTYHVRAKSRDAAGALSASPDTTFTTLPVGADTQPLG
jgi:hypothetical protein